LVDLIWIGGIWTGFKRMSERAYWMNDSTLHCIALRGKSWCPFFSAYIILVFSLSLLSFCLALFTAFWVGDGKSEKRVKKKAFLVLGCR
jgi:hypothetical protein